MKAWKRCAAALLSFIMMTTSVNISLAAGALDNKTGIWSATAADIVAEQYGLTANSKIEAVLCNGAINTGMKYEVEAPYNNGTADREDLIAVDYVGKKVYVKSFEADGYTWYPSAAVLVPKKGKEEELTLTENVCFYNDEEYYADAAFTYEGNSYTVEVTYQLPIKINEKEQKRLLEIPAHIGQAVKNIEKTLGGMWYNLQSFGEMVPYLYSLLDMYLATETMTVTDGQETKQVKKELFFDPVEHAAEVEAIQSLYAEYMTDTESPGLQLFWICDESLSTSDSGLVYAMENGAKVRDASAALYEKLLVLADSGRLSTVYNKLKTLDPELYENIKNLYRYLNSFVGNASKEGTLAVLMNDENWTILDEDVRADIFREEYDKQDFAKLETAAYAMRNVTYKVPEVDKKELVAAQVEIACEITTYDIVVTAYAKAVEDGIGNAGIKELTSYQEVITLLEGTTPDEVELAVKAIGLEDYALNRWNSLNEIYNINPANYQRTQTVVKSDLRSDVEYGIWYEPNYYTVKTDFAGKLEVPYGYQLEFPESTGEESWYDYAVTYADGTKVSYNQGSVYTVREDAEISRTTGTVKTEYRVYDFLAEDRQYDMTDAAKRILLHPAVESPYVKIRMPDESRITEMMDTADGYEIEAESSPSGISGMTWEPDRVILIDGDEEIAEIDISSGSASWNEDSFTHANVFYRLNITKVKDGLLNRDLTAEEVYESVNLPHTLVQEVTEQDKVLSGDRGVTAKTVYANMKSYEGFMGLLPSLKDSMKTEQAKNAIIRIEGNEDENIKGINGENLGCGGWSSSSEKSEPAFFKYLKLCKDSEWSLATYYEQKYYIKLSEQTELMADCLEAVMDDPGCIELLKTLNMLDKKDKIVSLLPSLRELAANLNGPNKALNVSHPKFSSLITELLESEGQTEKYSESQAKTICAYKYIRRNGANAGSITLSVQVGNYEKRGEIGYMLEASDASGKYHVLTENEAKTLQNMAEEMKEACGLEAGKEVYYLPPDEDLLQKGAVVRRNEFITQVYTPKKYSVEIYSGTSKIHSESFIYGSDLVIPLPAKSDNPSSKTYYRYIFRDKAGNDIAIRAVANGTTGSYRFKESDLDTLFENGCYSIQREEQKMSAGPELAIKPTLSNEMIRGAEIDKKNAIIYLDIRPEGMTKAEFREHVKLNIENATLKDLRIRDIYDEEIGESGLVENSSFVEFVLEDEFAKEHVYEYMIIVMGDVNGDGRCTDSDLSETVEVYFMELKKGQIGMMPHKFLAANMNNNKKIDSNDAWLIRSKSLYWNGDKKLNQIVYRSVLK